jgi:hypothetical protein
MGVGMCPGCKQIIYVSKSESMSCSNCSSPLIPKMASGQVITTK